MFADVQRLVRNLIAMNEILRDREHATIRLVMNPERMVIKEAQRTFTYLNLYGFVTDAVVINRVFPADVEGGYFSAWRELQQRQIEHSQQAFAPVPVLQCPFFDEEVVGPQMLERVASSVFTESDPEQVLYRDVSQELLLDDAGAELRLKVPFVQKASIDLKKIGLELIIRIGNQKRNIMLPSVMAPYRPLKASLEDEVLIVRFAREASEHAEQTRQWTTPSNSPDGLTARRTAKAVRIPNPARSIISAWNCVRSAVRPTSCARRCRPSSTSSGRAFSATPC